jgi:ADP-L-glycero-D-manno-heptose 6-epimerase
MIIVTGGAGFIGSNIIKGLNDLGMDDILVVDNIGKSNKYLNLNGLKFKDIIHKDDFLQKVGQFDRVETVFHQGACSSTTETDGNYMLRNNFEYTKSVLKACVNWKSKLIYASSASVYGNGDNGFAEKAMCEYPLNVYASSKWLFDNYLRDQFSNLDIPVVGLRYFNVYGPQENHKGSMASVPFHFFRQIKEGGKMRLFEGSETFLRDFIYVEDAVKVNLFFLENTVSGIFNCGTGEARSFLDMAKTFQGMNSGSDIEFVPFPDHLKGKYQTYTCADLHSLRKAGYTDRFVTLEQGLASYNDILNATGGYHRQSVLEIQNEQNRN